MIIKNIDMEKTFFAVAAAIVCALTVQAQVFYRISGNGLEKPSYIFGTHHLAPLSMLDSIPSARKALAEADRAVGEIDMTAGQMTLASEMQKYMMAPADSTLRDLIAPDDYERVARVFTKYAPMPGMTLDMVAGMRPMVATSMVSLGIISKEMQGFNPQEQLDSYFQTTAKSAGKPIIGLETAGEQAQMLYTTTPLSKQAADLVEMLDNTGKVVEMSKNLNDSYFRQDVDGLLKLTESEDSDPRFMEALLDKRNAAWLVKLPEILGQGSSFIAVGALHLPGENGVVKGLRKLGYKVEPVWK